MEKLCVNFNGVSIGGNSTIAIECPFDQSFVMTSCSVNSVNSTATDPHIIGIMETRNGSMNTGQDAQYVRVIGSTSLNNNERSVVQESNLNITFAPGSHVIVNKCGVVTGASAYFTYNITGYFQKTN